MQIPLTCPNCGKTGQQSGDWTRPGIASGELIGGLNPEGCIGCWDIMSKNGIAPGVLTAAGKGGQRFKLIPRPTP